MSVTHATANQFLNLLKSQNLWIGLLTRMPDKNGQNGQEVDTVSYARQPITFSEPINSLMANRSQITFPQATESWNSIIGFGIFDAGPTGSGNLKWYDEFPEPANLSIGSFFFISAGGISLSVGL